MGASSKYLLRGEMSDPVDTDALLAEQMAYYRARAPEYDEAYRRQGRYDNEREEINRQWLHEIDQVRSALDAFEPRGHVLELASGTGEWTKQIARHADSVTAVDASPETLAIARQKLAGVPTPVRLVVADLFDWRPERRYHSVFLAFWLSHVPKSRFDSLWALISDALLPGGRFFLVDSLPVRWSTGEGTEPEEEQSGISVRRLNDGSEFRIVKVYWSQKELEARLAKLGWVTKISTTERFCLYGHGKRQASLHP